MCVWCSCVLSTACTDVYVARMYRCFAPLYDGHKPFSVLYYTICIQAGQIHALVRFEQKIARMNLLGYVMKCHSDDRAVVSGQVVMIMKH